MMVHCASPKAVNEKRRVRSVGPTHAGAPSVLLIMEGGVNPITKVRVVDPAVCHDALAVHVQPGSVGLQLSEIQPAPIVAGLQNKMTRDTP